MTIPELTEEQRIESFIDTRLGSLFKDKEKEEFTKKELAEFCLKEIDFAAEIIESNDIKDVEESLK